MKLDHFIWYPVSGKGYQEVPVAWSGDYNPRLYTNLFANEYIPIVVKYSKRDFRGYMLFNKPSRNEVLFTTIFLQENVDEYGRTGVYHHSVIIDRAILKNGIISLLSVEKAMREFEKDNLFPTGVIEQLEVPENDPPGFEYIDNLKKYVSKAAVETLATRMMSSSKNRTILRCLGSESTDRLKIAVYLVELLDFVCGIRNISFSTEPPLMSDYYFFFDLLILERAYPPEWGEEYWAVVLWDLEKPQLPRLKAKEKIYKKIDRAFQSKPLSHPMMKKSKKRLESKSRMPERADNITILLEEDQKSEVAMENKYLKSSNDMNLLITESKKKLEEKVDAVEEVVPEAIEDISIFLGEDEKKGEPVYIYPLKTPNPHIVIVGATGIGKTQTIKSIIYELSKIGVPVIVIDFVNEYGDVVNVNLDPMKGIFINPLELLDETPKSVKYTIAGMLKKIFLHPQADIQEGILRDAIKYAYEKVGIYEDNSKSWKNPPPSLQDVKEYLEKLKEKGKGDERRIANKLLTRLGPLFDLPIISNKTKIPLKEIVKNGAALFLKNLPGDNVKIAVAEFFLRHLWHYINTLGECRGLRFYIVMDEAHRLAYEKSPVAYLLREGRKFGVGVILSSQQPDDFESKELVFQNASTVLAFCCPAIRHAEAVVKQIVGRQDFELAEEIQNMPKFTALLKSHGEELRRVRVLPFFERRKTMNL